MIPNLKCPPCKWQKGPFVGISWDRSDPFTYLIWTNPDEGGQEKRHKLVHNVLWPRQETTKKSILLSQDSTAKLLKKDHGGLVHDKHRPPTWQLHVDSKFLDSEEQHSKQQYNVMDSATPNQDVEQVAEVNDAIKPIIVVDQREESMV
eukprot:186299-Ditylum_brightwellii.AAC.1